MDTQVGLVMLPWPSSHFPGRLVVERRMSPCSVIEHLDVFKDALPGRCSGVVVFELRQLAQKRDKNLWAAVMTFETRVVEMPSRRAISAHVRPSSFTRSIASSARRLESMRGLLLSVNASAAIPFSLHRCLMISSILAARSACGRHRRFFSASDIKSAGESQLS